MTISLLFLLAAGVCLGAAAGKVRGLRIEARRLRQTPMPSSLALVGLLTALGLALVTLSPLVQQLEDLLLAHVGRLVSNSLTLVAAYAGQLLLLYLAYTHEEARARGYRRLMLLAAILAVMAAAFVAAPLQPPAPGEPSGTFGEYYDTELTLVVYAVAYAMYLGIGLGDMTWLGWRYGRAASRGSPLQIGMGVLAAGGVSGLVYAGQKIALVLSLHLGLVSEREPNCTSPFTPLTCFLDVGLPALSVLALAIGATLPAGWRRVRMQVAYHRLHPLWRALYKAIPEVRELADAQMQRVAVKHRVYWRVIEIRDGILELRPLRDPHVASTARAGAQSAGLQGDKLEATVEAAVIAAALEDSRQGYKGQMPATADESLPGPSQPDLLAEIAWLERVSKAFTRSPIVAQARPATEARE